jgi:hypothetical protein
MTSFGLYEPLYSEKTRPTRRLGGPDPFIPHALVANSFVPGGLQLRG